MLDSRGISFHARRFATMYRTEPFVISLIPDMAKPAIAMQRFRKLIELGVEQILVAFDLPTQCGYDP